MHLWEASIWHRARRYVRAMRMLSFGSISDARTSGGSAGTGSVRLPPRLVDFALARRGWRKWMK